MAKRVCDGCGKERDLQGGRTCEQGHFICKECVWKGSNLFTSMEKKQCPFCKSPLR